MSKFLSSKYDKLVPYTPGEQPKVKLIKLNTNESPFPPSPFAQKTARETAGDLQLYSDIACTKLTQVAAEKLNILEDQIIFSNGSDEILFFAMSAFCDKERTVVFPDVTYAFYKVFADLVGATYEEIPVKEDLSVDPSDYIGINKNIFIANPNAQTGISLPLSDIEEIVKSNPDNIVLIDEAYVDFGGESAVCLINKYDNLIVTQTFSKSRSLAGARLGFAVASKELIKDLNTIKFSVNPYNVNSMTQAAGIGALADESYFKMNCTKIIENREYTVNKLKELGFVSTDSKANFILSKNDKISGGELQKKLREKGILVRHFNEFKLDPYVRITIGSREQMDALIEALEEFL